MLLLLIVFILVSGSSVTGALVATRLKSLQALQTGRLQALQVSKVHNSTIRPSSALPVIPSRNLQKGSQATSAKKQPAGRYYPEFGPLSFREMIAKETFRMVAQMALDRMPSKRHDSHEWYSSPYHYAKKKDHHIQGREFLESEEFILFLVGLGLASVLGMATMMAPLNQMMYTNAAAYGGGGPYGAVQAGPGYLAAQPGRRRKRSVPLRGHRREVDIEAVACQIERASRRYNAARRRAPRLRNHHRSHGEKTATTSRLVVASAERCGFEPCPDHDNGRKAQMRFCVRPGRKGYGEGRAPGLTVASDNDLTRSDKCPVSLIPLPRWGQASLPLCTL
ncbi:hypothetical protein BIW11_02887 [Tropilaelaps mercedesae]|uniref:Uncharacterized protein n=1 Tax=Tropilaelaps mercedesae TaxID=418985 RepID=A0A1V9XVX0_9ACAR|nr:hypothetical protein BIW11_02887 [Tropilaelaps mercedesae]